MKILVAEDDPLSRKVTLFMLQQLGFDADTVRTGPEVLEAIKKVPYELLLLDCNLPLMSGIEVTKQIRRELPKEKQPRIVATTASILKEVEEECLAAGMDDFLIKPVHKEDLKRVINIISPPKTTEKIKGEQAAMDLTFLKDGVGDNPELMREIGQDIRIHWPEMVIKIEKAIRDGDKKALEHWAHQLKGSLSLFKAEGAANLALNLEMLGKKGDLIEAKLKLHFLRKEIEPLRAEILSFIKREFKT